MKRNIIKMLMGIYLILWLAGCGGGGSSQSPPTATGKFIDAPVEGLKYVSGGQNGFTGPSGEFTYEVGQPVTFSVGGVVIGQALGASVVTPIELVKTAKPSTEVTISTPEVVQIAQFLLTASSLTSTGIKIDSMVTSTCAAQNINLSTATTSSFSSVINQIASTSGNRPVTSATDAQNHISASMSGLSSNTLVLPPASSTGGGSSVTTPNLGSLSPLSATFSIGGTVSGLNAGASLILQNNGSNNLNITSNGSFTFTTKQTSLSTYNVSILTPPSNQYCTITNGAGFVGDANVTNVDIICKPIPGVASLNEYRFTGELTGVVANFYVQQTLTNAPFQLSIYADPNEVWPTGYIAGAGNGYALNSTYATWNITGFGTTVSNNIQLYTLPGLFRLGIGWNGRVFPLNTDSPPEVILQFIANEVGTSISYNRLSESVSAIPANLLTTLKNPPNQLPEYTTSIFFDGIGSLALMNLTNVTYSVVKH